MLKEVGSVPRRKRRGMVQDKMYNREGNRHTRGEGLKNKWNRGLGRSDEKRQKRKLS
jgi:hypothetical protein